MRDKPIKIEAVDWRLTYVVTLVIEDALLPCTGSFVMNVTHR